jgi:hypothetical protein
LRRATPRWWVDDAEMVKSVDYMDITPPRSAGAMPLVAGELEHSSPSDGSVETGYSPRRYVPPKESTP